MYVCVCMCVYIERENICVYIYILNSIITSFKIKFKTIWAKKKAVYF